MKSVTFQRSYFIVALVLGLWVAWSTTAACQLGNHYRGGIDCEFNNSCEEKDCPDDCDVEKHETCSGDGGSDTEGCYDSMGNPSLCGHTEDDDPCGAQYCEECSKSGC